MPTLKKPKPPVRKTAAKPAAPKRKTPTPAVRIPARSKHQRLGDALDKLEACDGAVHTLTRRFIELEYDMPALWKRTAERQPLYVIWIAQRILNGPGLPRVWALFLAQYTRTLHDQIALLPESYARGRLRDFVRLLEQRGAECPARGKRSEHADAFEERATELADVRAHIDGLHAGLVGCVGLAANAATLFGYRLRGLYTHPSSDGPGAALRLAVRQLTYLRAGQLPSVDALEREFSAMVVGWNVTLEELEALARQPG